MTKELEVLKRYGLAETEAKLYLALLGRGACPAAKAAEDAGIDRTAAYDSLNRLIRQGIVSFTLKNSVRHYTAVNPQQLLDGLKEKESELAAMLPALQALSGNSREQTSVDVFKGTEGIATVLKTILKDNADYLFIGAAHDFCKLVPVAMHQFLKTANDQRIHGRLVCEEGFGDSPVDVVGEYERYRLISKKFACTTTKVWKNKTAFFVFSPPYYTILIENKEIADRHRLYFDYLWREAKEPTPAHKAKTLITNRRRT